jgi:hypothetical protein
MSDLLSYVDSGEHTKFKLLQNWREYRYYSNTRKALKVLVKFIERSADLQLKNYCKDVTSGISDVHKLLAYKTIVKILTCYIEELKIVEDMVFEYEAYLMEDGNYLFAFLGEPRPVEKLFDHRGL